MSFKVLKAFLAVFVLVALVRWIFWHGPVQGAEELPLAPIVDLHCHVAGIGAGDSGCFVSRDMRASWKFRRYLAAFDVDESELSEHGDAYVFERLAERVQHSDLVNLAVVLALDGVVGEDGELDEEETQVYVPNEFVAREVARYPQLLYGASVNPLRHDALERLEQAKAAGAVLVKWLPSIQQFDPADPRLRPFFDKLVELELPLLCHTGDERSFAGAQDELADPQRLVPALDAGVTVIAAHAASSGENDGEPNLDRLLEMLERYPRLYADVSALTLVNRRGHLDRVLEEPRLSGRLVYGSDYPLVSTPLVSAWYFPLHLTVAQIRELGEEDNPFDRDVLLKQALGVPAGVFARSARLLGIESGP